MVDRRTPEEKAENEVIHKIKKEIVEKSNDFQLATELYNLQARIKELEEALRFYANKQHIVEQGYLKDPTNYELFYLDHEFVGLACRPILSIEDGTTARNALAKESE